MKWTTEVPKKAGWYWWRYSPSTEPYPIEIVDIYTIIEVCADNWRWEYTDLAHGEWSSGPIPEPDDQTQLHFCGMCGAEYENDPGKMISAG